MKMAGCGATRVILPTVEIESNLSCFLCQPHSFFDVDLDVDAHPINVWCMASISVPPVELVRPLLCLLFPSFHFLMVHLPLPDPYVRVCLIPCFLNIQRNLI